MLHAIVMAGGSGTRFWPASRAALPKQLLPLAGDRTLLEDTVARLDGLVPPERMMVVTSERLLPAVRRQLPQLPERALVGEPCKRDTAPCVGLAALLVARHDPEATMAVMPSDHVIAPAETFRTAILQAAALVEEAPGRLVTFGIKPTYPAESFGYIEAGEPLARPLGDARACRVRRFKEKPPASVAREYLAAGNFLWNAGIFVWKAATILEALAARQPECLAHLERIVAAWDTPDRDAVFAREFAAIRGISIDYAVLEHADDVVVIEAPFEWDDLGGWSAVARQRGADPEGNTIVGRHLGIDSLRTIVHTGPDHLVVTVGLEDMLVVHTPDATLVADRGHEEAVRKVVAELEKRGWSEYL
ncbi:MAG: mannose-1-phosphate guanylyltransferase [Planctomycetia bacterium]|nr:mannose-1-phosphate guanylyltransferase [Planctomycetia bacterium]